jgi:hypothetical protein
MHAEIERSVLARTVSRESGQSPPLRPEQAANTHRNPQISKQGK